MKPPSTLLFGTAGIPLSAKKPDTVNGILQVKELGLGAMELEFVQGVRLPQERTPEVKQAAEKNNVVLTCHAPYFINLNSADQKKLAASKHHILEACRRLDACGGWSACFHAGYYLKQPKEEVYRRIQKNIQEILKMLQNEGISVWVRPELTGKPTQWGDLDEILRISAECERVLPCLDVAHYHARSNGKQNSYEEFSKALEEIEKQLGREALNNMHIHVAGIAYGPKGEKHHLPLRASDFQYEALCQAWKDFKTRGVVICESPLMEKDALLLQQTYNQK